MLPCCWGQHYKAWKIAWLIGIYGKCKYFNCFSWLTELPFRITKMLRRGVPIRPGSRKCKTWCKAGGFGRLKGAQCLSLSYVWGATPGHSGGKCPLWDGQGCVKQSRLCPEFKQRQPSTSISCLTRWTCKISPLKKGAVGVLWQGYLSRIGLKQMAPWNLKPAWLDFHHCTLIEGWLH